MITVPSEFRISPRGADGYCSTTTSPFAFRISPLACFPESMVETAFCDSGWGSGIRLRLLSREKGQTSRIATSPQSRHKIHFGVFRKSSLTAITVRTSQLAVMLILTSFKNKASIAAPPYRAMIRRISSISSSVSSCRRPKAAMKAGREPSNFLSINSSSSLS